MKITTASHTKMYNPIKVRNANKTIVAFSIISYLIFIINATAPNRDRIYLPAL